MDVGAHVQRHVNAFQFGPKTRAYKKKDVTGIETTRKIHYLVLREEPLIVATGGSLKFLPLLTLYPSVLSMRAAC